ncbi:hypothetical protein N657DRAFT_684902 [Parathielavia appendiculata]|uniref:Uncharacterized protein n=1 Tax=Parathielavia appendiculata TaxID=2587402 RepID=A0AAN6TQM1_9PEZI|nr:hypothetical protein N657DRAFT_684902 [Parathielavia appendiculata]
MSAVPRAINILYHLIYTRDTSDSDNSPRYPPFSRPDEDDDDTVGPFQLDPDNRDKNLSPRIIAAIVLSVVFFLIVIMGLLAYLGHRRRKARKGEIALKEASTPAVATASGALDPPPPYQKVHDAVHHQEQEGRWGSEGEVVGEEEDSHAIGSHATITDGMGPGTHNGADAR